MHKKVQAFLFIIFVSISCCTTLSPADNYRSAPISKIDPATEQAAKTLYETLELSEDVLKFEIFRRAFIGYKSGTYAKPDILSIVDFSQPSTAKRIFIIDVPKQEMLFHTFVSHGKNTGENMATDFSNTEGTKQSSLGFYSTAETYYGSNGYSLKLDGLEPGFNHNARDRYIVLHGADYVSQAFIDEQGRLGRSWGCPAVPRPLARKIIDTIKDGSCLYIHADNANYLTNSNYSETASGIK